MPELLCSRINNKPIKWYNNPVFPLIPSFKYRKGNEHNTDSYSLNWTVFKFWTLDAFGFELGVVADDHWGIGVIGILPYLRWAITIPCPYKLQNWIMKNLWRKVKG